MASRGSSKRWRGCLQSFWLCRTSKTSNQPTPKSVRVLPPRPLPRPGERSSLPLTFPSPASGSSPAYLNGAKSCSMFARPMRRQLQTQQRRQHLLPLLTPRLPQHLPHQPTPQPLRHLLPPPRTPPLRPRRQTPLLRLRLLLRLLLHLPPPLLIPAPLLPTSPTCPARWMTW